MECLYFGNNINLNMPIREVVIGMILLADLIIRHILPLLQPTFQALWALQDQR
jgi:hypothetical protein